MAFMVSKGAVVIDFCGPWKVFQDAGNAHGESCFAPYTVAETADPVAASAGPTILLNFTFQTAPSPRSSSSRRSAGKGEAYYFCTQAHKDLFDAAPAKFAVHDQTR